MPGTWPPWVDPLLRDRLTATGVGCPWRHQQEAAELAWAGQHVVIGTGTGSGKSLAYQLPALTALRAGEERVLYLSPTKALAADQLRAVTDLELPGIRAAGYDGDVSREERAWVRAHANLIFTNPDMLHRSVLPGHARFRSYLRRLRFVVVDECHTYHGMFGAHVAQVLRRLRRICAHYGSSPTFVCTSATTANPSECAERLTGLPFAAIVDGAWGHGTLDFALYEPPASRTDPATRRSALTEAGDLLADLVAEGARAMAFVRSRAAAEITSAAARRALAELAPDLGERIGSYRAGYLAEERREIETGFRTGDILGLATTNALELGIDITGLDAVVVAGWPGTVASLWQQVGRAGRAGRAATAIFVARDDPLDTYLVHHPAAMFDRPVEATVVDPSNPFVLAPHLECAAAELPLTDADLALFPGSESVLTDLVAGGRLRRRQGGWFWARHDERPEADLRGRVGEAVALVERATGRLLGHVDRGAADRSVHDGAVYLHLGTTYVVDSLDLEAGIALLDEDEPPWTTVARQITDLRVVEVLEGAHLAGDSQAARLSFGDVAVTTQVVSYLRRRTGTGEVLSEHPLTLPSRRLLTRATILTVADAALAAAGLQPGRVPGAAHAAEHAAIGLLPLFVTCDRWDVGGVSTARHPDTGEMTIFVYDGHPGGAGFAQHGYRSARSWLTATRDAIADCRCETGCPACVQSPKCGNGNEPLDKSGAVLLLGAFLDHSAASGR